MVGEVKEVVFGICGTHVERRKQKFQSGEVTFPTIDCKELSFFLAASAICVVTTDYVARVFTTHG